MAEKPDDIEMQDLKQRRGEEDENDQQDKWDRNYRDDIVLNNEQEETDFRATEQPDFGPLDKFLKIREERKAYYFKKFFGFPLRRDIDPELFLKTDFVYRKNSDSIAKIEYDGKEIYYFRLEERHKYANNRNSFGKETFDEKLKRAESKYISSLDPIMDEEVPDVILPRETSDAVLNRALTNVNLTIDRSVDAGDVKKMENIEKVYTDAEKIFNDEELNPNKKQGKRLKNWINLTKKQ